MLDEKALALINRIPWTILLLANVGLAATMVGTGMPTSTLILFYAVALPIAHLMTRGES